MRSHSGQTGETTEREEVMMNANKMRQWIVMGLGIGSLALAILVGSAPTVGAAASPTQVAVVNTPTVNASQNGAWSVGITGTPTVAVTQFERKYVKVTPPQGGNWGVWTND